MAQRRRDMKKLAEETGGRVIEVGNKQEKLREAFEQIQNELRSQYNIGYTPTNNKLDGRIARSMSRPGATTRCRLARATTRWAKNNKERRY